MINVEFIDILFRVISIVANVVRWENDCMHYRLILERERTVVTSIYKN